MKALKIIHKNILLLLVAVFALSSCSLIDEHDGDCNAYYKVRFRFDRNMLFADAFSSQVGEVDLFVLDADGNIVWRGHEDGEILSREGYLMDLPVKPGKYDLVAWARNRHDDAADFALEGGEYPMVASDLKVSLSREYDGLTAHSSTDIHALFHGMVKGVELPDEYGVHVVTVPLTKDTNSIRIMLVHLSGKEIKPDDFDVKITDKTGDLDYDNTILDTEHIEYRTWAKQNGLAYTDLPAVGRAGGRSISALSRASVTQVHSLVSEMTTSRLQTCRQPILTVTRNSDGEKVIEIPVIDYFLMVKGEYKRPMDDDEYLDRQDDYHMTFFLHDDGTWYKNVIDILQWRVVRQDADL